eukprot:gene6851-13881_t
MGSYPSAARTKKCCTRTHHSSDPRSIRAVDRFLRLILNKINHTDGLRMIVQNPLALDSFVQFFALVILDRSNNHMKTLAHLESTSVSLFGIVSKLKQELLQYFSQAIDNHRENEQTCRSVVQLALSIYLDYINSDFFDNWRIKEAWTTMFPNLNMHALPATLPELQPICENNKDIFVAEASASVGDYIPTCVAEIPNDQSDHIDMPVNSIIRAKLNSPYIGINSKSSRSVMQQALNSCDQLEVCSLHKSDGWLTLLITAAETLPIGISLSAAYPNQSHYPVIYANKYLEVSSGCEREHIIGRNFTLLHDCNRSDDQMKKSLNNGTNSVIIQSNTQPTGLKLITVLGIKSIYDQNCNFRFVIGIQIDIIAKDHHAIEIVTLVKSLIHALPNITIMDS